MEGKHPTLGAVIRGLRSRFGWTLKEMSAQCGIPVSTLSKVENGRLTLTYDKLQQFSQRLNIRMSDLFVESDDIAKAPVTARRSIGKREDALVVNTQNYDYEYLCTELRGKLMVPLVSRIRARTLAEFGPLVRHPGEEVVYVLEGRIEVHTQFYDPVVLDEGQSIYIDSTMGHAYLLADGCDDALVFGVCASAEDNLMDSLIGLSVGEASTRFVGGPSGKSLGL